METKLKCETETEEIEKQVLEAAEDKFGTLEDEAKREVGAVGAGKGWR